MFSDSATSINSPAYISLYTFRIIKDGILVRDFVPCIRISDNKKGLYDIVEGRFYTNKGTDFIALTTKKVIYGQAYGELPIPEKTGHTFEGWYTSAEGGKKVTSETIVTQTQDHTLYARWEDTPTIFLSPTSGKAYKNAPDKTIPLETKLINSLTVTSANSSIATATVSAVENNQAALTIHPIAPGTTTIQIQDPESNASKSYEITVEETNYYVAGVGYETLNLAYAACTLAGTTEIIACRNVTDNGYALTMTNHNVDLNLQNFSVTRTNGITINSGYTLTVNGTGTLTSTTSPMILNKGTLDVKDTCTLTCSGEKTIENQGTLNINSSSTISNTGEGETYYPVYNNGGTVIMTNGTIIGKNNGIYMNAMSSGNINISGGNITTTGTSGNRYGIYAIATTSSYAKIVTLTGTARVTGGTYGIYANGTNTTINVGSTAETISTEYPAVTGEEYGIYKENNGIWNFYNGILKGKTECYNAVPTAHRNGYSIIDGEEILNNIKYKTVYLGTNN